MFCCTLLYVRSSIAIILMGKRELVALLNLSSWCLLVVERLFLAVPWGCLRFVIVVFPDHTHILFMSFIYCYLRFISFIYLDLYVLGDLFVCFIALRPKSTAMVIAGRSVYLTTLFPGQA